MIWNPYYKKYVDNLENVQRKFLRTTHYRCHHKTDSYDHLLKYYKLVTLKARRTFLETMFLYDLCNNKYDCPDLTNKICYIVPRTVIRREVRTRPLFALISCRTNAGVRAPLYRLAHNYNVYSSDLDIFSWPANKFRHSLLDIII